MANATTNLLITVFGFAGYSFDLPVCGATAIFEGTLIAQLTATGMAVPYSTAGSDRAIGVAQHGQDNRIGPDGSAGIDGAKRIRVECGRLWAFANGAGADAFADTDMIGSPVYGTDDHTVAKTSSSGARKSVGYFMGFEVDGRVRVFVNGVAAV